MRFRVLLLTHSLLLALAIPVASPAQASHRTKNVERFETSGLPAEPTNDVEKEIFLMLRTHKKGDLSDASRIHVRLAQYYKERGKADLEDVCNTKAIQAWEAASGERPTSAGSPSSPPFEPTNTFTAVLSYVDDLKVEHTWEFFSDGTFSHTLATEAKPDGAGPRERGWYTLEGNRMRLWEFRPRSDRRVSFELLGDGGKDGAVMDGVKMEVVK